MASPPSPSSSSLLVDNPSSSSSSSIEAPRPVSPHLYERAPEDTLHAKLLLQLEGFHHLFNGLGLKQKPGVFPYLSSFFADQLDPKFAAQMEDLEIMETLLLEMKDEDGEGLKSRDQDVLLKLANILYRPIIVVQSLKLWWGKDKGAKPIGIFPTNFQPTGNYWDEDLDDLLVWFDEDRSRYPALVPEHDSSSSELALQAPEDHQDKSCSKDADVGRA